MRGSRRRAAKCARAHISAERSTANPENNKQETPYALPEGRTLLLASTRRRSLGFIGAGAPFRPLFCPIPSFYVPGPKIFLPTTRTAQKLAVPHQTQPTTSDKQESIERTVSCVKSLRHVTVEIFTRTAALAFAMLPCLPCTTGRSTQQFRGNP
jgi:hypothetical protein